MSTEGRADPFGVVALAAAGALTADELGYVFDRSPADGTHAYFGVLGPVILLSLCAAGWAAAVRIVRRDVGRAPSLAMLAGLQLGGYLTMEIVERLFTDSAPTFASPPVLIGLALQPAIAWLALQLLAAGRYVVEALLVAMPPPLLAAAVVTSTPVAAIVGALLPLRLRVRGPPLHRVLTQRTADPTLNTGDPMKHSLTRRAAVVPALFALALAACGSDADTTASTDAPMSTDMDDMDMEMDDMNMGDADATPADDVPGAALARGEYTLMDSRPAGYDDVGGTAVIARSPQGTTITTELTGLLPNVDYISHAHAQACDDDNAGPHYQFEVGGSEFPPNEIHLAFTSDNDGNGFMTAENAQIAGPDAVAFVVHPTEFIDNKVACVDFVEDEPGSIDAAIAAGLADTSEMDEMEMDEMEPATTDG